VLLTNAFVLKVLVDNTQCSSYDLVGFSGMKFRSVDEIIEF
jgi:hypothetical protein